VGSWRGKGRKRGRGKRRRNKRTTGYLNTSFGKGKSNEEKHMQFELFKSPRATIKKRSGSDRSVSNITYHLLTYLLKAPVQFGQNRSWKKHHLTSSK
jgi:hypothetical protein